MKVRDKIIVVTGGGAGMGRELVLQLLERGAKVAAADIQQTGLDETAELAGKSAGRLSCHLVDISNRSKVNDFPRAVIDAHGAVDGIINNAGIIQPFQDVNGLSFETVERIMNVNFYGTLYMIQAFLPHLLERPEAHIANVSSMGGFIPFPGQTVYGASKAAVKLLTEGLYAELRNTNVGVTVIHPGAVATNIKSNSGLRSDEDDAASKESSNKSAVRASDAAVIMINAVEKNKYRVMVGRDARALDILYRLNPRRAVRFIVDQMQKR